MGGVVLWDVDTQVDFMLPHGKLYVPGAEETIPAAERLVRAAREAGAVHVASIDDHELTDPEISDAPDFANTYPPHCLRGTPGGEKVPETKQQDPLPFYETPIPPGLLPAMAAGKREFVILKKNFNVFTNPNTDLLLSTLDPGEVIVFGVATDVCSDAVILGLLHRGRKVTFVEEAGRGLDQDRVRSCTKVWRERGVQWATVDEAVSRLT